MALGVNWAPQRRTEQTYAQWLMQALKHPLETLGQFAEQAALRMVSSVYFKGARTWREAATRAGKGRIIHHALRNELDGPIGERFRDLVKQNAKLIKAFPESVAAQVAARAAAQYLAGGRSKELKFPNLARSRARLIARTEVGKASTALTQARSENMGIPFYVWQTSQDERVRKAHRKMQGVLVPFDDPPSPEQLVGMKSEGFYNAGDIYNCRCYPSPLIRYDEVTWPHRVYDHGRIQYMTLSAFKRLNQAKEVRAA